MKQPGKTHNVFTAALFAALALVFCAGPIPRLQAEDKPAPVAPNARYKTTVDKIDPGEPGGVAVKFSEGGEVKIVVKVKGATISDLTFAGPCELKIMKDKTLLTTEENLRARDSKGNVWASRKVMLDGQELIAFYPEGKRVQTLGTITPHSVNPNATKPIQPPPQSHTVQDKSLANRFVKRDAGIVLDTQTSLEWIAVGIPFSKIENELFGQRTSKPELTKEAVAGYLAKLTTGGHSGWGIPTDIEFETLPRNDSFPLEKGTTNWCAVLRGANGKMVMMAVARTGVQKDVQVWAVRGRMISSSNKPPTSQNTNPSPERPQTTQDSIHGAASDGDATKVRKLLQADPSLLEAKDSYGMTALHLAAREGQKEIVEFLLSKGADVNAKYEKGGGTPLHLAALNGKKDIASVLIAKGADVNAKNHAGMTPASCATAEGHSDIVKMLGQRPAQDSQPSSPPKRNPSLDFANRYRLPKVTGDEQHYPPEAREFIRRGLREQAGSEPQPQFFDVLGTRSVTTAGAKFQLMPAQEKLEIVDAKGLHFWSVPGKPTVPNFETRKAKKVINFAGLTFAKPCKLEIYTDGTLLADKENITAQDEQNNDWQARKVKFEQKDLIAFFPASETDKLLIERTPATSHPDNGLGAQWPSFTGQLHGSREVRVKNPNEFSVKVGLRSHGKGRDFIVAKNDKTSVSVPDGAYDIYFRYSTDPTGLYQGDSFRLSGNGVEIQIVKVVNGNYGIRKVK